MISKVVGIVFAYIVAAAPGLCLAESCDDQMKKLLDEAGRPRSVQIYLTKAVDCFGKKDDADPIVAKVNAALSTDAPADQKVRQALEIISGVATAKDSPLVPVEARDAAVSRLKEAARSVSASAGPGSTFVADVDWQWSAATNLPAVCGVKVDECILQIDKQISTQCSAGGSAESCLQARNSAHQWLRISTLTALALGKYSEGYFAAVTALSARRIKMWHAYRDEALPQFPWEYALNSYLMKRNDHRPTVNGKNPEGYESVPTSQIVLLHPGASLEWRDAKEGSTDSNAKPALYLEVIGINRWSFDESTGAMLGGKGVSLMVSYANREGRTSTGYGIMFHSRLTKQFTLGITRAGDETVYLINVDLAEYFKQNLPYWNKVQFKIDSGQ